jgi:hypothetical protein
MGSTAHYAYDGKEMLGWICEKMAIQELAPRGGKFFASDSTVVGNGPFKFPSHNVESKKGEA